MKSVGVLIKEARIKRKISRKSLERATKIKEDFIEYLENESWNLLPEYPVTVGFVKNISAYLHIDKKQALALLRRDFPQKILRINPKPDINNKVIWSPKTTVFVFVLLISLSIIGYLFFQYSNFIRSPILEITSPSENDFVYEKNVVVKGTTDKNVSLTVNNQPILVDKDGNFLSEIPIYEGTQEIVFVAKSRSGKVSTVIRKIKPSL